MRLTTRRSQRAGPGPGWIRSRLTYASVMSTLAVFGVLAGGGAWAASKIGPQDIKRNAVRAKHVKRNQIRAKHIKGDQVRAKHVRKDAVRTPKIRDGAVTAAKLADGVEGVQGPAGPKGDQGEVGPTFGANLGFATPVASPDDPSFPGLSSNDSFSLPSPGHAFVSASFKSYRADCDAGIPRVGLYVDGEPIPGTERELQDNIVVRQLVVTGISEPLAAGGHELDAGVDCPDGSLGGRAAVFASASVILIGG
jgi:hypothetical protein